MILTEKKMIKILREEYENRLYKYLNEEIQMSYKSGNEEVDIWKNADECKVVHDETGFMYTFAGYENDQIKLYLPDEPRFINTHKQNKILTGDSNIFNNEMLPEEEVINQNTIEDYASEEPEALSDERDYILVTKNDFVKNYSLA